MIQSDFGTDPNVLLCMKKGARKVPGAMKHI